MSQTRLLPRIGAGYWISPNNHFLSVAKHICSVCEAPTVFGTTELALREVYERFHEEYCSELGARKAIIKVLIKVGWIRMRNYVHKQGDYWSVNVPELTPEPVARVCAVMRRLYGRGYSGTPVILDSAENIYKSTVDRLIRCATPLNDFRLDPKTLPELIYVAAPQAIPRDGIPLISMDTCMPRRPKLGKK